jgi:hypothetical protein
MSTILVAPLVSVGLMVLTLTLGWVEARLPANRRVADAGVRLPAGDSALRQAVPIGGRLGTATEPTTAVESIRARARYGTPPIRGRREGSACSGRRTCPGCAPGLAARPGVDGRIEARRRQLPAGSGSVTRQG